MGFLALCYTKQGKSVVQGQCREAGTAPVIITAAQASLSVGVALGQRGCFNMWRPCARVAASQVLRGSNGVGAAACCHAWLPSGARDPGVIGAPGGFAVASVPYLVLEPAYVDACMRRPPCHDTDQSGARD